MKIETIVKNLKWTRTKIINDKFVRVASPDTKFWQIWKEQKHILKANNITVYKSNGSFEVNQWLSRQEYLDQLESQRKNIVLRNSSRLLKYQVPHTKKLIQAISEFNSAIDGSDTGTGKSFSALAVARHFNMKPFIVCPKSIIPQWWKYAEYMKVDPVDVLNYEQLKTWKTPYAKQIKDAKGKSTVKWFLNQSDTLIIFDEAHRCKGNRFADTINSKMLRGASDDKYRMLLLSATIAESPIWMRVIGYSLGLFNNNSEYVRWGQLFGCAWVIRKMRREEIQEVIDESGSYYAELDAKKVFEFIGGEDDMKALHKLIYNGNHGARMRIADLGSAFPDNQVLSLLYRMENSDKIQNIYLQMERELEKLRKQKELDQAHLLTEMLRARQQVELLKVPTIVELTEDLINENRSVVIFVNFEDSLQAIAKKLKTSCIISGKVTGKERENNLNRFQADKDRVIVCNIRAGGVGVSLHDLHGNFMRVSLICPTWSAVDLKQALGRIHRAGGKTPALQRIIFASNTVEEAICKKLEKKLNNINALNDGDLMHRFEIL